MAVQALAEAVALREQAEPRSKESVYWVSRIFALGNDLIKALIELETWRNSAEGQGVTGLPWIASGQMSLDHLRDNQAKRRELVDQI